MHHQSIKYPNTFDAYELIEEIGLGTHTTVWKALCKPLNQYVAVKKIDLEKYPNVLDDLLREIQVMKTSSHPNIVTYLTSFVHETELFLVMELMDGGSISDIMRYKYPKGFGNNEELIATILKQVLSGLHYFHKNGQIHRDIKAGNILVSKDGRIQIGDFGVSAHLIESGDRRKVRQTFVGTPCWMAPEVMEQLHGYDYKADIWSFGITAMELANGAAPFADYEPIKIMYLILESPPPKLEDTGDKKFSKQFKEMVEMCLQKDPKDRPDTSTLLKHKFFSKAKSDPQFIINHLLTDVPPLGDRIRHYKAQMAEEERLHRQLAQMQQEQQNKSDFQESGSPWSINKHQRNVSFSDTIEFNDRNRQAIEGKDEMVGNIEQREGNLLDISGPVQEDGKPSSGWNWEEKLNIVKDTEKLMEQQEKKQRNSVDLSSTEIDKQINTIQETSTLRNMNEEAKSSVNRSGSPSSSPLQRQYSDSNINAVNISEPNKKIGRFEVANVDGLTEDLLSSNGSTTSTTSLGMAGPVSTRPIEVKDVSVTHSGRQIEIKTLEGPSTDNTRKSTANSGNLDDKSRQGKVAKVKTEPTIQTLYSQIAQLTQMNQQQMNFLNALCTIAENQTKSNLLLTSSKYKDVSDIPALMAHLEIRIKELLEENSRLKKENEALRAELRALKVTDRKSVV